MASPTLCFTCGQPVTDPPQLCNLPDGEPCPSCRERALDVVAAALPAGPAWAAVDVNGPDPSDSTPPDPLQPTEFRPEDLGDDFPEPA